MATTASTSIGILGTGSYVPKQEVSNEEVAERVRAADPWMTPEWIERKTRIRSRRYAAPDEATSDLAAHAGADALQHAGLRPEDIDFLLVSTSTPDHPQPPTAHLVQHQLGAYEAACMDLNVVCSGFVYALAVARSLVAQKPGSHALVIAAEVYSRFIDVTDRRTAVLMADGAGAAVVGPTDDGYGFVDFELAGRGDAHGLIRIDAGGSRVPPSARTVAEGGHFVKMEGRGVRDFVLENLPPALEKLAGRTGVPLSAVHHFVPHQPNGVMLQEIVDACGLGGARTHRTLDTYGNVGSASVALTLDDAHRAGHLAPGDVVLLGGFGGGMAIGAGLLRWAVTA
ncbi:3-oxoacyl-ACP synthase III family protein [Streptomyces sp. P6-2-1]|uniref:3-oxoacyl-ACP synthase III family protein n=1 Tax=unclassified Streptomyces TaxID=2593676 RepID=UPI003D36D913